jgi:hypothetical protein
MPVTRFRGNGNMGRTVVIMSVKAARKREGEK